MTRRSFLVPLKQWHFATGWLFYQPEQRVFIPIYGAVRR